MRFKKFHFSLNRLSDAHFFFLKKSENQFTNNKCDLGERAKSLNRLFQCYLVCFSDPKNRIPVAIQLEATAIIKAI